MAKKDNNFYFDTFSKGIGYSNDAAALLQECLGRFKPEDLQEDIDRIHKIEHDADLLKHTMVEQLMKEFLPPFEREDIMALGHAIDEVTDCIEDVLLKMYILNVTSLREEVTEFTDLILRSCKALKVMLAELHNFKKSNTLSKLLIQINDLEEEGDRLYAKAMRRLYTEETDPIAILAWSTVFGRFERCCDSCEDVASVVEQVVMKNS